MEKIESDQKLRELTRTDGFIYNDFGGAAESKSSRDFNKLHRATCPECSLGRDRNGMTVKTTGQKLFFATFREACEWLTEHRPGNYTKCTRCEPR